MLLVSANYKCFVPQLKSVIKPYSSSGGSDISRASAEAFVTPPQERGLYVVAMSFSLSVRSFVCLSPKTVLVGHWPD